jgi:hypothetical protein
MSNRNIAILALLLVLAACATQPAATAPGAPGFWLGFVHGLIVPFALITSLFEPVRIYAFPNAGGWYDLGYFLGIAGALGGGTTISIQVRPSRRMP